MSPKKQNARTGRRKADTENTGRSRHPHPSPAPSDETSRLQEARAALLKAEQDLHVAERALAQATAPTPKEKPGPPATTITSQQPETPGKPGPPAPVAEKPAGRTQTETRTLQPEEKRKPENPLKTLPLRDVLQRLETSQEQGLSAQDAQDRIRQYGPNALRETKTNPLLKFLTYFWGPIPWMIEIACALSAVAGHWADFVIIGILLLMNGLVGFWEEFQAGNTIAALKSKLATTAHVKRGGKWQGIDSKNLVPGDVIRLRLGNIVPADCRILEDQELSVDQSALTGESLPVSRNQGDALFSGSVVKQGETDAVVYATGGHTYFGKTADLVQTTRKESHFQKAVLKIGDFLIIVALALVVIILAVSLLRGDPFMTTLLFVLVLTVAAIPVAMPAVLSVTMAVGARNLAKKKAIVTRLSSIEELAGIDVLCSDKTGTLTQNKLTVQPPATLGSVKEDELLLVGALASRREDEDVIDQAVLNALKDEAQWKAYTVQHFQPFDPVHKRTEATVKGPNGKIFKVSKGAPQVILSLCDPAENLADEVNPIIEEFAHKGYRSLGVARTDSRGHWQYLGVIPMADPPREDSKATVETARQLGVQVKMVTGDQLAIAREIAQELGMGQNILNAEGFGDTRHHETGQMADQIEQADGFAQVYPEHKYHIVDTLQSRGHYTGMTGDGVNDAPALKKAHVGIAVAGATDAARAASDIVLTSPGLSVIIDALKEARRSFQRMNSYAIYRITETIRVLLFMTLAILAFNFYPVTAVMIVLLAILNDAPILAIAFDRTRTSTRPEAWDMPMVLGVSSVLGVLGVMQSFGLFYLGERVFHFPRPMIQTFIFLNLVVAGHLTIFLTRTRNALWSFAPSASLFWSAILTKILATLGAVYGVFMHGLGWGWAGFVWGYALLWAVVNDRIKLAAYRLFNRDEQSFLSTEKREKPEKPREMQDA